MKNIFLIIGVLSLSQCSAQRKTSYTTEVNTIKDSIMFEKFDFDLDSMNYAGYEYLDDSYHTYGANGFYKLKNGGAFSPDNYKENRGYYVIPPSPAFYSISYMYYENGNIKVTGKIAGFSSGIKIGKWKFYDEIGRMTEVDEDKKFGLWDFNKILSVLDKDDAIDLESGKNREYKNLRFFFDKVKKVWTVNIFKKEKNKQVEEYWEYLFDCNTGKYSREWYERYNDDVKEMMGETGTKMPPLKNSKKNKQKREVSIYKTYEGKNYTEQEWNVFEQQQYNEHLRKTGRADLIKPNDSPSIDGQRNRSFLADEDDVKPKKKGFWG